MDCDQILILRSVTQKATGPSISEERPVERIKVETGFSVVVAFLQVTFWLYVYRIEKNTHIFRLGFFGVMSFRSLVRICKGGNIFLRSVSYHPLDNILS
jgi:hypothetical protein